MFDICKFRIMKYVNHELLFPKHVRFPAVTICNLNMIRLDKLPDDFIEKILEELKLEGIRISLTNDQSCYLNKYFYINLHIRPNLDLETFAEIYVLYSVSL